MDIEQEINTIKERNKRVEADKAWEVSWVRRLFITVVTYIAAGIWLVWINDSDPLLKALVPSGAYILSTLTLPAIKRWWVDRKQKS